ncbi:MAG: integrase [Dehalococcoidia bacterium]
MTTLIKEVYEAFKEAGVSEEKAAAAATAIAGYEDRFTKIEHDLALLKWMLGFNLALTSAVLFKLVLT